MHITHEDNGGQVSYPSDENCWTDQHMKWLTYAKITPERISQHT